MCRDHDDRQVPQGLVRLHLFEHLETAQIGHEQIEQHQVERLAPQDFQGLGAVLRHHHVMDTLQTLVQVAADDFIVIDEEQLTLGRGHGGRVGQVSHDPGDKCQLLFAHVDVRVAGKLAEAQQFVDLLQQQLAQLVDAAQIVDKSLQKVLVGVFEPKLVEAHDLSQPAAQLMANETGPVDVGHVRIEQVLHHRQQALP